MNEDYGVDVATDLTPRVWHTTWPQTRMKREHRAGENSSKQRVVDFERTTRVGHLAS